MSGPKVVPIRPTLKWPVRTTPRGNIIADLRNVLIILRNDPGFEASFGFDAMEQTAKVIADPAICQDATQNGGSLPRPIDAEDITRLQEWMQHNAMPRIGRDNVEAALDEFARERSYHPLRSWLEALEWDETPRRMFLFTEGLGCPNDEYHRAIGLMFPLAMVARILKPGCQADYMPVLVGPQGELKSEFCRTLASDDYFSDALPDLTKDPVRVSMHLRGKWLIEIPELAAFSNAKAAHLKAFITQRVEIYTPKYGRRERTEPRQCLFIGTTNEDEFNKDETGGRRFWPIKVGQVNIEWLKANREQIFAEAVHAYETERTGWWPTREFERRVIAPKQADHQVFDHWTAPVLDAAETIVGDITTEGLWRSISGDAAVGKMEPGVQRRIAAILKSKGYEKNKNSKGNMIWRKT